MEHNPYEYKIIYKFRYEIIRMENKEMNSDYKIIELYENTGKTISESIEEIFEIYFEAKATSC